MLKRFVATIPPAYWMVLGIFAFGALTIDGYTSTFSIRALLVLSAFLIIASAGQTMTMLIGGIDLSIPFVVGFANVAVAQLGSEGVPFGWAMVIVIGLSVVLGAFNGALSLALKVHPLIITLGTGTGASGRRPAVDQRLPNGKRASLHQRICVHRRFYRPGACTLAGACNAWFDPCTYDF